MPGDSSRAVADVFWLPLCPGRECCEGETTCCAVGDVCCGDECCDEDRCCGNGECCAEECEECLDNGTLSGGTVTVVPQVVCIGQTITFTVDGVVDSGGLKRVDCSSTIDLPAVEPSYTWVITKPDSTTESGSGASANVTADQAGVYSCIFTATANRDCPPADRDIGPATGTADGAYLDLTMPNPGAVLTLGNDLLVEYEVGPSNGSGFDSVELEISNAFGNQVFVLDGLPSTPGNHSVVWADGRWNVTYPGTFANPNNGPYEIKLIGQQSICPDDEASTSVFTELVIEADVKDDMPGGATATRSAGLDDMLDALEIVMKLGTVETIISGPAGITVTGPDSADKHVRADAPVLNTLQDGAYDVLFRNLRDEIGNFADSDGNASNGIQPITFTLELR